jgi:hypothetical protein
MMYLIGNKSRNDVERALRLAQSATTEELRQELLEIAADFLEQGAVHDFGPVDRAELIAVIKRLGIREGWIEDLIGSRRKSAKVTSEKEP